MSSEYLGSEAKQGDAPSLANDISAGACLGLLLGILIGLSSSPVVSTVVTALVALLAGLFGLDKGIMRFSAGAARRLACFGLAASLAVPLGLWLRASEAFSPTVEAQRQMLKSMGVTDEGERKELLKYLRLGIVPTGAKIDERLAESKSKARDSVLYGAPAEVCGNLTRLRVTKAPAADILRLLRNSDATQLVGERLAALDEPERTSALGFASAYLCAVSP